MRLQQLPLVLHDNLFYDNRSTMSAASAPCADWRMGTKWTGAAAANGDTGLIASRACNCFAIGDHDLYTNGWSALLQGSLDDIAWDTLATLTPTSNIAMLTTFAPVAYTYYRCRVQGGATAFNLGLIAAGMYYKLPKKPTEFTPHATTYHAETPRTRYGTPIGTIVRTAPIAAAYTMRGLRRTVIESTQWLAFKEHSMYPSGLPFFMRWDAADHPTEVWFCQIRPGYTYSPSITPGVEHVGDITLPIERMQGA